MLHGLDFFSSLETGGAASRALARDQDPQRCGESHLAKRDDH